MFEGKRGLVLGVANKRSIAWAIARRLAEGGAQLAFTFQGERIESNVRELAESVDEPARHRVRRPLRRGRRARLLRGGRRLRRAARPARALGRLRGRRGSRGPLHRHAARPLLDGARRQRVLARRLRARRRAADGGGRRRLDRDDDLPRWRAGRAALQRDGRRQGDARLEREVPRLGSRPEEHPRERRLGRPGAHARRALDRTASRRWRRSSRSAPRSTATSTADDVAGAAAYLLGDDARNVTGTTLYVDSRYHAMGM